MSIYFADTIAFAKRYIPEVGTAWIQSWIEPQAGNVILISLLGPVEFVALLARRQRENSIPPNDFIRLRNNFLRHANQQYKVISLTKEVSGEARLLVAGYPLRTLDALQLACAIVAAKIMGTKPIFVSADQRLLTVATSEGFSTDDPNAHP